MKKIWEYFTVLVVGLLVPLFLLVISNRRIEKKYESDATHTTTESIQQNATVDVLIDDQTVVNMPLEDYVFSVVLREMPADFELEALKAQAVVARTYTLRHISKPKHNNAQVCTESSCCQGYWDPAEYLLNGGTEDNLNKVRNAVEETSGEILIYDGKPIDATYFSCSGGMTEDAAAVWGDDVPYLKATASPGEERASYYVETVRMGVTDLTDKLGITLQKKSQFTIGNIHYTPGGGVATVDICGQNYTGIQLRKKLGLRSTAFVISVVGDRITITTKGFGHRVGMSQYGADAMAIGGADYVDILLHYYFGVELTAMDAIY